MIFLFAFVKYSAWNRKHSTLIIGRRHELEIALLFTLEQLGKLLNALVWQIHPLKYWENSGLFIERL